MSDNAAGPTAQTTGNPADPTTEQTKELPLTLEIQGHVAWMTFTRPAARNAISRGLVASGLAAIETLRNREDVRCVVITGAGDKAFCAGADLKERRGMSLEDTRAFLDELGAFCGGLASFPRPTIAALNGVALGGGFEIALCADIRIAVEGAEMGLPEVQLGIIPGAGGTQRLGRVAGLGVAKALVLSGRRIDAALALRLGIVTAVVAPSELRAVAGSWAEEISAAGPLAVAEAKRAMDEGWGQPMDVALAVERAGYERVVVSEDRNEGLAAFAEKRRPAFTGK
jgi:enoyl-CoA hydratase/carnithine racemase